MMESEKYGPVTVSGDNIFILGKKEFIGEDFLSVYGGNVIDHFLRTNSFSHVLDILVNSVYDIEKEQVFAFEVLIGSHGGVGGELSRNHLYCIHHHGMLWTI